MGFNTTEPLRGYNHGKNMGCEEKFYFNVLVFTHKSFAFPWEIWNSLTKRFLSPENRLCSPRNFAKKYKVLRANEKFPGKLKLFALCANTKILKYNCCSHLMFFHHHVPLGALQNTTWAEKTQKSPRLFLRKCIILEKQHNYSITLIIFNEFFFFKI